MALSERERRFVEAFMGPAAGNATEAARLAGYSAKTAQQIGSRQLLKAVVREAIAERQQKDPLVANRAARQKFWTDVMQKTDEAMRDRLKASELLGRSQADFIEKHVHEGLVVPASVVVVILQQDGAMCRP